MNPRTANGPFRRGLRFLSRISIRLLAFNLLLVFLPAIGLLSLETYESHLLQQQERAMVQQGRLLAAALGEQGLLEAESASRLLGNLRRRTEARLRVLDAQGSVLADSSRFGPRADSPTVAAPEPEVLRSPLYRLGRQLYRLWSGLTGRPTEAPPPEQAESDDLVAEEIRRALDGGYGSFSQISPHSRSLVLHSAIPIESDGRVVGVALVSRSTLQILRALWDLRLATFRVILASVGVAVVLSLLVSTTIARPLRRLRAQAHLILDRRGRLRGRFRGLGRLDEIGDLSRALAELTRRLEGHLQFLESFASDVSHEFKNPLAAIRNALELAGDIEDPLERRRFLELALRDVARLEQLLSGVREITAIDAGHGDDSWEIVDLADLGRATLERLELRPSGGVRTELLLHDDHVRVRASPLGLSQIVENLVDNALGFSPREGLVRIEIARDGSQAVLRVVDEGPGIPEEHLGRVFDRFFSYRPAEKDGHTGLGLAIVMALAESFGGEVKAANGQKGAVFEVRLPLEDGP